MVEVKIERIIIEDNGMESSEEEKEEEMEEDDKLEKDPLEDEDASFVRCGRNERRRLIYI